MEKIDNVFLYLDQKLPLAVNYDDLANLCFSLFCTLDILPKKFHEAEITKEVLANAFALIAKGKDISVNDSFKKNSSNYTSTKHWINLIDYSLNTGKTPNLSNAKSLLNR